MVETGNLRRMGGELPLGSDPISVRRRIEALEQLLEGMFVVPGLNRRVGLDALLGLVPVAGDLFDFLYRSNTRNLKIIKQHLDKHHPGSRTLSA